MSTTLMFSINIDGNRWVSSPPKRGTLQTLITSKSGVVLQVIGEDRETRLSLVDDEAMALAIQLNTHFAQKRRIDREHEAEMEADAERMAEPVTQDDVA